MSNLLLCCTSAGEREAIYKPCARTCHGDPRFIGKKVTKKLPNDSESSVQRPSGWKGPGELWGPPRPTHPPALEKVNQANYPPFPRRPGAWVYKGYAGPVPLPDGDVANSSLNGAVPS